LHGLIFSSKPGLFFPLLGISRALRLPGNVGFKCGFPFLERGVKFVRTIPMFAATASVLLYRGDRAVKVVLVLPEQESNVDVRTWVFGVQPQGLLILCLS
jgi:hypothetical protein